MKLDKNKIGVIGIDRIKVYVDVVSVNTELNADRYSVATEKATKYYKTYDYATDTHINLSALKYEKLIATMGEADNVKYGLSINKDKTNAILDIVLPRATYGIVHNIYNVIAKNTIMDTFECIIEELKAEGIEINSTEEWEVFSMEVNKTIISDKPLIEYKESLLWFLDKAFDYGYTNQSNNLKERLKDGSVSTTLYFGTNRIGKKIYDKSAQIRDTLGIFIKENLIRLELTYNKEALQRTFLGNVGIRKPVYLEDVLVKEKIEKSYNKATKELNSYLKVFVDEEVQKLESQFEKANYKEIERIYKENANGMFDILFLVEATEKVYKGMKNRNFNRDIKKLLKNYDSTLYGKYNELHKILIAFNRDSIEFGRFDTINKKYFK